MNQWPRQDVQEEFGFSILAAYAYIDTIKIFVELKHVKGLASRLRSLAKNRLRSWERAVPASATHKKYVQGRVFCINQPTTQELDVFIGKNGVPHSVQEIHIATDFHTATQAEADRCHWFLRHFTWLKWPGDRIAFQFKNAVYESKERKTSRNAICYADKKSRTHPGVPCCHFEMRFKGQRTIKRAGLDSLEKIVKGLPVLDHLKHQFKLVRLCPEALLRIAESFARSTLRSRSRRTRIQKNKFLDSSMPALTRRTLAMMVILLGKKVSDDVTLSNLSMLRVSKLRKAAKYHRSALNAYLDWEEFSPPIQWFRFG